MSEFVVLHYKDENQGTSSEFPQRLLAILQKVIEDTRVENVLQ